MVEWLGKPYSQIAIQPFNHSAMKTGLLECDHVLPEFRHIGGDYRDMFPALLPGLNFVNYDVCNGHFPKNIDECEAWLCTGSRHSVYDEVDWIIQLKEFVKKLYVSQKKFVGVCFGHQMLAEALGGKVEKAASGWCVGVHAFEVIKQEVWMAPFVPTFNLPMSCRDQVVGLPQNSVVLAKSPDCPVGMYRVGERMLGIQAHPEFPLEYAAALMESRVERIGTEKIGAGRESLCLPVHREEAASWIAGFLSC
jgi:GMP synthase-like glutamine amidotransferase